MSNLNDLLTKIESAKLWNFFHKDWLLQIRLALREQLPADYRVFVESEAVLISPDSLEPHAAVLPDVVVTKENPADRKTEPQQATTAIVEAEEAFETETHYRLIIRRAPDHQVVAAMELLSPSNKGVGNRTDREKHLRKRSEYLDAGVSLWELDVLLEGERDIPAVLAPRLETFDRIAWTAYHEDGRRKYRGWGWNQTEPLPQIDWRIDAGQTPVIDLEQTLRAAMEFNRWEELIKPVS